MTFVFRIQAGDPIYLTDLTRETPAKSEPSWLQKLPGNNQKTLGEVSFQIVSPAKFSDLLITVNFTERTGGFLKVIWKGADGTSQMLSDNFYEGIYMPNQRRLLISRLVLKEGGTLTFQSSQEDLLVSTIQWEWLEPKIVSVADEAFAVGVISSNGLPLTQNEVSGDPSAPLSDEWKGSFITAPLIERPERLEQGTEFQAEFESSPTSARLEGWFNGIALDKKLNIWINGHPLVGSMEVPDLSDPGYQTSTSNTPSYAGWRKMQLWLPTAWLQPGMNKIQLSWEGDSPETNPVSVKNLCLQLGFNPPPLDQTTPKSGIAISP